MGVWRGGANIHEPYSTPFLLLPSLTKRLRRHAFQRRGPGLAFPMAQSSGQIQPKNGARFHTPSPAAPSCLTCRAFQLYLVFRIPALTPSYSKA